MGLGAERCRSSRFFPSRRRENKNVGERKKPPAHFFLFQKRKSETLFFLASLQPFSLPLPPPPPPPPPPLDESGPERPKGSTELSRKTPAGHDELGLVAQGGHELDDAFVVGGGI